eukprot:6203938-Pleurochrysis_carterae.AAC.3
MANHMPRLVFTLRNARFRGGYLLAEQLCQWQGARYNLARPHHARIEKAGTMQWQGCARCKIY